MLTLDKYAFTSQVLEDGEKKRLFFLAIGEPRKICFRSEMGKITK